MLRDLSRYYRQNRLRLTTALFAAFAAATIQIKYWVYYNHDCLKLNPYGIAARHQHPRSLSLRESRNEAHCEGGKAAVLSPASNHKQHDHNHCAICQSFQQLTEAIFEPPFAPDLSALLLRLQSPLPVSSLLISFLRNLSTPPRAPPFV